MAIIVCFNSRSREGSDWYPPLEDLAPTTGFNSRSREGSDPRQLNAYAYYQGFNSRSREGSDNALESVMPRMLRFNSRSREGSDPLRSERRLLPRGFNSRSREGSDNPCACRAERRACFNSRSREGSDVLPPCGRSQGGYVSIHAPVKGATLASGNCPLKISMFQFTLP